MTLPFKLTKKYLDEQISDSEVALQKHSEGVRIHEIVLEGLRAELETLPEEEKEDAPVRSD